MLIKIDRTIIGLNSAIASSPEDRILSKIEYWWIELNESGKPIRKIGFNNFGLVIYLAPQGQEYGFWSDSPVSFENPEEYELVDKKDFQRKWKEFNNKE